MVKILRAKLGTSVKDFVKLQSVTTFVVQVAELPLLARSLIMIDERAICIESATNY